MVVKSSRKEGGVFIDFAISANTLLGDGESTQEDEEIKSNKANNVLFYVDLCFSETDPLSFFAFFQHTHTLFFFLSLLFPVIHTVYILL